jgi:proteasome activator subunit 4
MDTGVVANHLQIFDYASNNVRANAVRAIHQLVECVANANPVKTLAKFFTFCETNIRTELDNGFDAAAIRHHSALE